MDASAQTFPDGTDRALNLANVRVGGDRVKVNGVKGSVEAVKVMVSVDINDVETSTVYILMTAVTSRRIVVYLRLGTELTVRNCRSAREMMCRKMCPCTKKNPGEGQRHNSLLARVAARL
jgi:hypothetical protein